MTDPLAGARESLRTLVADAHEQVVTTAEALAEHKGGTAVYNQRRDEPLLNLPSFRPALDALKQLPAFERAFGSEHDSRATLQFLYAYLTRTDQLTLDEDAFDATFDAVIAEINDPNWTYVSFANLRNFESDDALIDFGDGVTIRHRSFDELQERLGWTEWHLEELQRDWMRGHAPSSHIIWVESSREKSPETAILTDSATGAGKALNLLLALWLFAPGDVSVGPIYVDRAAKFDLAGGGLGRTNGMPEDMWGSVYTLSAADTPAVRAIYDDVVAFRESSNVPGNIEVAIRRFSSVYTRGIQQREDRIIDELIALEALAGSGTELRFRLAFRVSSLLAEGDDERAVLFEAMKGHYDLRSKIVHGNILSAAQQELVRDDSELRSIVRRLLQGVIFATVHSNLRLSARYIDEELDKALLNTQKRDELRETLGLR